MIAGIVINSANDLMFSQNGTIAALAAVLVTSVYTVVSFALFNPFSASRIKSKFLSGSVKSRKNSILLQCKFYITKPQ